MIDDGLYYRVWAYCQKQDICFFTYKESLQDLIIVFTLIAFTRGVLKLWQKCLTESKLNGN